MSEISGTFFIDKCIIESIIKATMYKGEEKMTDHREIIINKIVKVSNKKRAELSDLNFQQLKALLDKLNPEA